MSGLAKDEPFVNSHENGTPYSLPYRDQPYFVSEFGGIWWDPDAAAAESGEDRTASWGYGERVRSEDEFHARFSGLTEVLLGDADMFGYCYTQLTDVFQVQNGIYPFDRGRKLDVERIRAAQLRPAAIEERDRAQPGTAECLPGSTAGEALRVRGGVVPSGPSRRTIWTIRAWSGRVAGGATASAPRTALAVTQDRVFLQRLTATVLEAEAGKVTRDGDGDGGYRAAKAVERRRRLREYEEWRAEVARNERLAAVPVIRLDAVPREAPLANACRLSPVGLPTAERQPARAARAPGRRRTVTESPTAVLRLSSHLSGGGSAEQRRRGLERSRSRHVHRRGRGVVVAGEAEAGHGPDDFADGEVTGVLPGDDLAHLSDRVAAAADGHGLTGDELGRDALHRGQHPALGQLERVSGDDAAHDASQGGRDGLTG